jgi:hypothetical protein
VAEDSGSTSDALAEGFVWNPLADTQPEDVEVAQGSMPCVYSAGVTIIEPRSAVTSWGGPVRGGVVPDDVALDPGSPFYGSPLDELAFDVKRGLYYASPAASGRPFGSALLRAGNRLVLVESGYYIREEVTRDFQYPAGATGFSAITGEGTADTDTLALVDWIQERLGAK